MQESATAKKPTRKKDKEPEYEERIDDHAIEMFGRLGYKGVLPTGLVETYKRYKLTKDILHASYLTPEGYATVIFLWKLKG